MWQGFIAGGISYRASFIGANVKGPGKAFRDSTESKIWERSYSSSCIYEQDVIRDLTLAKLNVELY